MSQYTIRVVFSATPTRMGKFIRATTNARYNHVSVSLREGGPLYSFSRKYCNVPFCGGFVKESPLRYQNGNRKAHVRICTIPVSAWATCGFFAASNNPLVLRSSRFTGRNDSGVPSCS